MKKFSYQSIGGVEERGTLVRRDLILTMEGGSYILSVATQAFIQSLKDYNRPFEEKLQFDENILPMDSVEDLNKVVHQLSQMPQEEIDPYLIEQVKTTPNETY